MGQMRLDVGRMLNQVRRGAPKLSASISAVEHRAGQLREQVNAVKSEIQRVMERYTKELKDRQRLLESELDTFLQGEQRALQLLQENCEVELASMASYCDSTESTLNQSTSQISEAELVTMKNQCLEYMDTIRQNENQQLPPNKQVCGQFNEQNLHESILRFGELLVTTQTSQTGANQNEIRLTSQPISESAGNTRPLFEEFMDIAGVEDSPVMVPDLLYSDDFGAADAAPSTHSSNPSFGQTEFARIASYYSQPSNRGNTMPVRSNQRRLTDQSYGYMAAMGLDVTEPHRPTNSRQNRRQNTHEDLFANIHQLRHQVDNYSREGAVVRPGASDPNASLHRNINIEETGLPRGHRTVRRQQSTSLQDASRLDERPVIGGGIWSVNSAPPASLRASVPRSTAFTVSVGTNSRSRRRASNNNENASQNVSNVTASDQPTATTTNIENTHRSSNSQARVSGNNNNNDHQDVPNATSENNLQNTSSTSAALSTNAGSQASATEAQGTSAVHGNNSSDTINMASVPEPAPPVTLPRSNTFTRDPLDNQGEGATNGSPREHDMDISGLELEDDQLQVLPGSSVGEVRAINNYQQKGAVVKVIGGVRGNSEGCFTWPRGVAVKPDGHIVISDSSNHRVQVFNAQGHFQSSFGSYGQGDGEFDCIAGVAVTPSGSHILISDRYNHRIQILNARGHFVKQFGREGTRSGFLSYPWGIACDADFIYVCDKDNHRVQIFKFDGSHVRSMGSLGNQDGQFDSPQYVALMRCGDFIVSDSGNHRIQIFNTRGEHKKTIGCQGEGPGQFKHPLGVAVDQQGFIVVGDSGNNRIQILKPDGRFFYEFGIRGTEGGQFKGLEGVAILQNGNIAVCDRDNHRVQIF